MRSCRSADPREAPVRTERSGARRISLRGEVDVATAPLLDVRLAEQRIPPGTDVVLDVSGVSFMDASGLSALIRADRRLRLLGGRLRLTGVPRNVARLLLLTRLDERFDLARRGQSSWG
ncbi:STAS domain-containing protein [Planomonospora corallina]|uniref:Anti-sigma factor antagonist n=1 Tax=Planomonospora corallina TaxID=1806052 RepID=A0ABV8IC53_9ACTN